MIIANAVQPLARAIRDVEAGRAVDAVALRTALTRATADVVAEQHAAGVTNAPEFVLVQNLDAVRVAVEANDAPAARAALAAAFTAARQQAESL